jgi:drug/metabolite transporter (DMT)-like permease
VLVSGWSGGADIARHPAAGVIYGLGTSAAYACVLLQIPLRSLGWMLTLALVSGVVGWLLITRSLPRLPAAVSSLLLLLEPAGALVLDAIFLGQRPSLIQIVGAGIVCAGVLFVATQASAVPLPVESPGLPSDTRAVSQTSSGTAVVPYLDGDEPAAVGRGSHRVATQG